MKPRRCILMLSDASYFSKARRTIQDLRIRGAWKGDIVLVAVDFQPPTVFLQYYHVWARCIAHMDTSILEKAHRDHPIRPMTDQRHTKKLVQWDKLCFFEPWVHHWDQVLYVDAGYRVCHPIDFIWSFWKPQTILSLQEPHTVEKQFDWDCRPDLHASLREEFPDVWDKRSFQNGLFLYDPQMVQIDTKEELERVMMKYPISLVNEMGILNLVFQQKACWDPLPLHWDQKQIVGWTETPEHPHWSQFIFIKYSSTLPFDV